MAVAAVRHQTLRLCQGLVKGFALYMASTGGQLLVSELLADVHGLYLTDQDLGGLGHLDASQLGDGVSGLSNDLGVQSAVDQDGLSDLVDLSLASGNSSLCIQILF